VAVIIGRDHYRKHTFKLKQP